MSKKNQFDMFDVLEVPKLWQEEWMDMPEFEQANLKPSKTLMIHFEDELDIQNFSKLINQTVNTTTKSIWYPKPNTKKPSDYKYIGGENPKYPIYIISKGRWENRLTSRALEKLNVPYYIVIEPQEFDEYSKYIDKEKILVLPFSNLGQGSIPARNWVWEHSIFIGAERHWILDDNIDGFVRLNRNIKIPVTTGATFKAIEDFTDRYENVALSGMNYRFFAEQRSERVPAFYLNTRVYSCILINNKIPYRWRGCYNEDTDLSIRALKDGWCTILFQAFLCNKAATMTMKGGNTDELYQDDGRLQMAQSLVEQHPDIVKVTEKWGRYQHHVNYDVFKKNKLIRKDIEIENRVNNYGMMLVKSDAPCSAEEENIPKNE